MTSKLRLATFLSSRPLRPSIAARRADGSRGQVGAQRRRTHPRDGHVACCLPSASTPPGTGSAVRPQHELTTMRAVAESGPGLVPAPAARAHLWAEAGQISWDSDDQNTERMGHGSAEEDEADPLPLYADSGWMTSPGADTPPPSPRLAPGECTCPHCPRCALPFTRLPPAPLVPDSCQSYGFPIPGPATHDGAGS